MIFISFYALLDQLFFRLIIKIKYQLNELQNYSKVLLADIQ